MSPLANGGDNRIQVMYHAIDIDRLETWQQIDIRRKRQYSKMREIGPVGVLDSFRYILAVCRQRSKIVAVWWIDKEDNGPRLQHERSLG